MGTKASFIHSCSIPQGLTSLDHLEVPSKCIWNRTAILLRQSADGIMDGSVVAFPSYLFCHLLQVNTILSTTLRAALSFSLILSQTTN